MGAGGAVTEAVPSWEELLEGDGRHHDTLVPWFEADPRVEQLANQILDKGPAAPEASDHDKDRQARRQATAAMILLDTFGPAVRLLAAMARMVCLVSGFLMLLVALSVHATVAPGITFLVLSLFLTLLIHVLDRLRYWLYA